MRRSGSCDTSHNAAESVNANANSLACETEIDGHDARGNSESKNVCCDENQAASSDRARRIVCLRVRCAMCRLGGTFSPIGRDVRRAVAPVFRSTLLFFPLIHTFSASLCDLICACVLRQNCFVSPRRPRRLFSLELTSRRTLDRSTFVMRSALLLVAGLLSLGQVQGPSGQSWSDRADFCSATSHESQPAKSHAALAEAYGKSASAYAAPAKAADYGGKSYAEPAKSESEHDKMSPPPMEHEMPPPPMEHEAKAMPDANCIQQCQAGMAPPPSGYMPPMGEMKESDMMAMMQPEMNEGKSASARSLGSLLSDARPQCSSPRTPRPSSSLRPKASFASCRR